MRRIFKLLFYLITLTFLFSCHSSRVIATQRTSFSQRVEISGFYNLYKVDDHLYRSEQPDSKGMLALEKLGIGTVLNVRNCKNDDAEIKGTNMERVHLPMRAAKISYDDMVTALKTIKRSSKKVLVHCKHGSDRTGCIVAAYRMAFCGWTKEQAINEFLDPRFGYHSTWFPNILNLLNTFDVEKLKKDVNIAKL